MERTTIPPDAKKVFSGVLFDVYQWEQELFDGSKGTWERIKRSDSVTVIAVHEGRIVVSFEEHPAAEPFTSLPCGFIERGEEPLAAAKRELREETGLVSDEWEHYASWPVGSKISWDEHVFIARGCRKEGEQHLDAGERVRVESVDWDGFLRFIVRDDFRLSNLSLHLLRLQARGGLDAFRKRLFPTS